MSLIVQTLVSAINQISIRETNCVIHCIDFYSVDSTIQLLNNQGPDSTILKGLKVVVKNH